MNKYINSLLTLSFCLLLNNNAIGSAITPEMKANAEKAIKTCEDTYNETKKLGEQFVKMKKPGLFASSDEKKRYSNLEAAKKAFEKNMNEFTRFTNDKIKIRTAETVEKFRDESNAYSSNCKRFATGIAGFVDWALKGKVPEGFDIIYEGWIKEVQNK